MINQIKILKENKTLLDTAYDATVQQNRLFMYIIYKLQQQKNNQGVCSCTIAGEELRAIISDKNKRSVEGIKELLNQLVETTLIFETTNQTDTYTLIAGYRYAELSDKYKIQVVQQLYDHIVESIASGRDIELQKLLQLKTRYAQKLFEVLEYYREGQAQGECELNFSWLKRKLGVAENEYTRYNEFKERVLKTAVQHIHDAGFLVVTYKVIRQHRQVVSIIFYFKIIDQHKTIQDELINEIKESYEMSRGLRELENIAEESYPAVEVIECTKDQQMAMKSMMEELSMSRNLYPVFMREFAKLDFTSDTTVNILLYAEARTLEELDKDWIHEEEYPEFEKWIRYYQAHTELFGEIK